MVKCKADCELLQKKLYGYLGDWQASSHVCQCNVMPVVQTHGRGLAVNGHSERGLSVTGLAL